MGASQRKVLNYIKNAGLSKGYYLHILGGGVAFLVVLLSYASRLLGEINLVVSTIPDAGIIADVQDRLFMVTLIFFVSFFAFICSTVFYMIILGQRVGGPVIAICAYIDELKKGNYDVKRQLRKHDELIPVMNSLQELSEILRARQKQ